MSPYKTTISWVHDNHAPLKVRKTSSRKKVPWYNEEIANIIRCRRKSEQSWLSDKNDREKFNDFYITRRRVANQMTPAECWFYLNFLSQHKTNMKEIFRVCDKLLGRNQDLQLTPSFSKEELGSRFSDFFIYKIAKIWETLATNRAVIGNHTSVPAGSSPKLPNYSFLSEQDMIQIITKSPSKSCVTDPIPTDRTFEEACRHAGPNLNQAGKHIDAIWLFSRWPWRGLCQAIIKETWSGLSGQEL